MIAQSKNKHVFEIPIQGVDCAEGLVAAGMRALLYGSGGISGISISHAVVFKSFEK